MRILKQKISIPNSRYLDIFNIIKQAGGQARLIGGVVRDSLLNIPSADIDIATDLTPEQNIELFTKNGYKVIPTGINFGTVTIIFGNEKFEVTTLRKDISTDGRRAKVEYTNDFLLDAERRDFTINAISYDPIEEVIYDYFDGIDDLHNGKVRFIGDADKRIKEDYLRILRFFRFSARFAKGIDQQGLEACKANKEGLNILSKERIKSEMDRLLEQNNAHVVLLEMIKDGIWPFVFASYDFDPNIIVYARELAKVLRVNASLPTLYALIFADCNLSNNHLIELKFSRSEAKRIVALLQIKGFLNTEQIAIFLTEKWLDEQDYQQFFIVAAILSNEDGKIISLFKKLSQVDEHPDFPIKAQDLQAKGLVGPEIGNALRDLRQIWIANNFRMTKDELTDILAFSKK